jgi:hypothetical protein
MTVGTLDKPIELVQGAAAARAGSSNAGRHRRIRPL